METQRLKIPHLSPSLQSVILKPLKIIELKYRWRSNMGYNVAIDGPAGAGKVPLPSWWQRKRDMYT